MKSAYTATSLPTAPDTLRERRMQRYMITMLIRTACVLMLPFVHGWWMAVVAVAAIVLPYIAVLLANNSPDTSASQADTATAGELDGGATTPQTAAPREYVMPTSDGEWVLHTPTSEARETGAPRP